MQPQQAGQNWRGLAQQMALPSDLSSAHMTLYSHHADARCDGVADPNDNQLDILYPGAECNILAACKNVVSYLYVHVIVVVLHGEPASAS